MARTANDPRLVSRTARLRLKARREPYWRPLEKGRAIGYRRLDGKAGTWIAKRADGRARRLQALGTADDLDDAGMSFAAAQAAARAWFAKAAAGGEEEAATGPYTVRQAAADYLAAYEAGQTKGGGKQAAETRTRIAAHILPRLGDKEVARLTAAMIQRWHGDLARERPRLHTRKGEPQQYREIDGAEGERRRKATANRLLATLKAVLNHAFTTGRAASDTAWRRVRPFREADAARLRFLTAEESRRIVNAAGSEFRPMVVAGLLTGCRYGELAALDAADFDEPSGTLHVRRSKSGKARRVVLTDEGVRFFTAQAAGKAGDSVLLPRPDGARWGKSHAFRRMRDICTAARLSPGITFHGLRHTYASSLVMAGVPLPVVAANLGHSDTRMVERHYGHMTDSYVTDSIRSRAPALGIVGSGNVATIRV